MSRSDLKFARGDRVVQVFPGRAIVKRRAGVIMYAAKWRGDWMVQFDDDPSPKPRLLPVYERDLEPESPNVESDIEQARRTR